MKGKAIVSIAPYWHFWYNAEEGVIVPKTISIDGKGTVEFDPTTFIISKRSYSHTFELKATVIDELTGCN